MAGDYSRNSFDALRDYAAVLLQQGHPTLDADWNELIALLDRRLRAETVDTIGRAVVPRETPLGFEIRSAGGAITIGRGRMYVDGLVAENHGRIGPDAAPAFDRARLIGGKAAGVLDEAISAEAGDFIAFGAQPYLPLPPALPTGAGPHIAYLDVWRREVTPLKEPRLLEPALGGIDTATRMQTVWQVKLLADAGGNGCGRQSGAWDALVAPSAARLTTATIEYDDPDEPCLIPPGGGYRGLENQLYRVELHTGASPGGGPLGGARFKWSRDNASVGAGIEAIEDGARLRVRRIGRDDVLRFRTGDWVEVTDDRREFAGLSGDMRRVEVDEDAGMLRLDTPLSADLVPAGGDDTAARRHSRVIRWDQQGQVMQADGTAWHDLDAAGSDGTIPVPPAGTAVVLEAGITISFSADPAGGGVARALDHWCFAARTATADIERLAAAPPAGIHHHFARLAIVAFPDKISDCRIFWPPEPVAGGTTESCGCTVCVTAEEHNSGARTIQSAIAQLPAGGGTVCLAAGGYVLGNVPVVIDDRSGVRLHGQGVGTVLAYAGTGGAVRLTRTADVTIDDLAVLAIPAGDQAEAPAGFAFDRCTRTTLQRTAALVASGKAGSFGVALSGYQIDVSIADNLIVAGHAVATPQAGEKGYCLLVEADVAGNLLIGRRGVSLEGKVLHIGATRISDNLVFAAEAGAIVSGYGAPIGEKTDSWTASTISIERNTIGFARDGDGVVSGVADLRLADNAIVATGETEGQRRGSCVRLVAGLLPLPRPDAAIHGNRLGKADGYGLLIEAPQARLSISGNVVRDCRTGGIAGGPEARIETLELSDNLVERTGTANDGGVAAGIRLAAIGEGRISGNSVREVGIGASKAQYWAGIDLRGAGMLDVSHNMIARIGPELSEVPAFAIRIEGPLLAADVSANRLTGLLAALPNESLPWSGIALNARLDGGGDGLTIASGDAAFPAFIAVNEGVTALTLKGARAANRIGLAQIGIEGNLVNDARQRSRLPLVIVRSDTARTDALTFTGNQVRLLAEGIVKAIVQLEAPRLVVSNNVVHRLTDADAIALTSPGAARRPAVTVLGNITMGNIRVNGASVPPPFDALNILG